MPPRQKSHLSGRLGSLSARRKASSTAGVSDASEKGSKRVTGEKLKNFLPKFKAKVFLKRGCHLAAFVTLWLFFFAHTKSSLLSLKIAFDLWVFILRAMK